MSTKASNGAAFSNIDPAGTGPNRYANIGSPESLMETATKSLIPGKDVNIGKWERIAMIAAGSYLLYKALSGKKKNISGSIAAGAMIVRGASGYCPVYDAVSHSEKLQGKRVTLDHTIIIDKPVSEVYRTWRNLSNLPEYIEHLSSVRELGRNESEWTAKGPAGIGSLTWKAHILEDVTDSHISWQTLPDAKIRNSGKVTFTPIDDNRTQVDVNLSYLAPFGIVGEKAAHLLSPWIEKNLSSDIEGLKRKMENNAPEFTN